MMKLDSYFIYWSSNGTFTFWGFLPVISGDDVQMAFMEDIMNPSQEGDDDLKASFLAADTFYAIPVDKPIKNTPKAMRQKYEKQIATIVEQYRKC